MTSGVAAAPCFWDSAFRAARSRSIIMTRAPAASIATALASPMPDAAPVTAATLPSNSPAIAHLPLWRPSAPLSSSRAALGSFPPRAGAGRAAYAPP